MKERKKERKKKYFGRSYSLKFGIQSNKKQKRFQCEF